MAEALYRKYRPQVFEDVVGQEPIERTLKNAIRQDKVSHAYLFCGPRGTGKTTTARLLAKALLCAGGPTPDPDGTCEDCRLVAEGTHPDVYELDAASRTGVENVREEIIGRVHFAPTRGRSKIYIIDEVHMLSTAAFNALLKTLEEPPAHVVFILCTTDPQKVPDTIHSRCQRFDFHRIAPESMVARLGAICMAEEVEFEGEALDLIAQRAGGGLRDALTSLEQIIAFENGKVTLEGAERLLGSIDSNDLAEIMAYVGARDIANCFRWTANYVETGADLAQFVRDMAEHVRNLYVMALVGDDAELDVTETARRELAGELAWFGPDRASRMLGVLGELMAELKTASNARLAFEIALTRLVRPDSDLTLEALAERVEALEGGYSAVAHVLPGPMGAHPMGEAGVPGAAGTARAARAPEAAGVSAGPDAAAADGGSEAAGVSGTPGATGTAAGVGAAGLAGQGGVDARDRAAGGVSAQGGDAEGGALRAGAEEQAFAASSAAMPSAAMPFAAAPSGAGAAAANPAQEASAPVEPAQAGSSPVGAASVAGAGEGGALKASNAASGASMLENPAALQRVWQAALAEVKRQKQAYGVLFMNTKAIYEPDSGRLKVQFTPESTFAYGAVQKPDVQDVLAEALEKAAGAPVEFFYTQGVDDAKPVSTPGVRQTPEPAHQAYAPAPEPAKQAYEPESASAFEPVRASELAGQRLAPEPASAQASAPAPEPAPAKASAPAPVQQQEPPSPYVDDAYEQVPYEDMPYDFPPYDAPAYDPPAYDAPAYDAPAVSAASDTTASASPGAPNLAASGAVEEDPSAVEALLQASFGASVVLSETDE